jgi:hypothetical protein
MSANIARLNSVSHLTWQAHCNHAQASEQHLSLSDDWPRATISLAEFNYLCDEALQCLREPKDVNALLESVWLRLCYWLGSDLQLSLPKIYEYQTTAYLQAIGQLLQTKLCDAGQEDQRTLRLVLTSSIQQAVTGEHYEM